VRNKLVTVRGSKIYLSRLIALSIWTIGSLGVTIWLAIPPWNPIALFTGMLFLVTCCGWYFTLTDKDGKEHDKTIADSSKAIELDPEFALAYGTRGLAYYHKGEYDKAMADFNKAVELDPEFALVYGTRGLAYYHKGEYDKAIADFNKAIELDPEFALAYRTRGFAYMELGEKEKAISDFEKFIELSSDPALIQATQKTLDELRA